MKPDSSKNMAIAAVSTILSLAVAIGIVEAYEARKYKIWKKEFESSIEWFEGVTTASSNPILMWEYKPKISTSKKFEAKTGISIQTNNFGFRDKDFKLSRSESVYRVAFIGDSVTLGLKVDSEKTFVKVFERMAGEAFRDKQYQAMNFAVDGYNTIQVGELLRTKVLQFKPELVIYVLCLNDFDFQNASGSKIRFFKKPASFFIEKIDLAMGWISTYKSDEEYHTLYYNKNKDIVFEEVKKMKSKLDEQGIGFLVVVVPIFPQDFQNFHHYPVRQLHHGIVDYFDREEIDVLDLLSHFEETELSPNFFSLDIWHANEFGHAFIAEKIFKVMNVNRDANSSQ